MSFPPDHFSSTYIHSHREKYKNFRFQIKFWLKKKRNKYFFGVKMTGQSGAWLKVVKKIEKKRVLF